MQLKSNPLNSICSAGVRAIACLAILAIGSLAEADDVALSWSDNSDNEDGFTIERANGEGGFQPIAQVGADVETFTDATAEEGVDYRYRVNAYNAFGASGYTNVASHYINVTPTLAALQDVTVEENETAEAIVLTVWDLETDSSSLEVTVSSSNEDLIDAGGVVVSSSGDTKNLTLTPKPNTSGQCTLTVTVSDGEDARSEDFLFSVNAYVFPTLQLSLDSIAEQPRAGEAFLVQADASDPADISSVSYWIGEELVETVSGAPYKTTLTVSEAGSYRISAVASIVGREGVVIAEQQVYVGESPADASVVQNLATLGLEQASPSGAASYDLARDTFTLEDEYGRIGGVCDSHRYYYLRADGDVAIEARVSSFQSASSGAVVGLMVRSALYGKAPQASLLLKGDSTLGFCSRSGRGDATQERSMGESSSATPWLRIEKTGTNIRYYSRATATDAWTLLGSDDIDLGDCVFLGFALAGGSAEGLAVAAFTQVDFEGAVVIMGDEAVQPNVPSGLLISGTTN